MREIKVRAWDKRKNKWIDPTKFAFPSSGHLMVRGMGTNWYVLSEFTGLVDRNNKEIWEGDKLEWSIYPDSNENLPMRIRDTVTFAHGSFTTEERHQLLCTLSPARGIEVVGNIYESGELADIEENERCHDDMLIETAKWKREI